MARIEWNNNMSVNIIEIDDQHKKLIGIINELSESMRTGRSKVILGNIISDLIGYTEEHFQSEENFLEKFNCPDREKHKQEHLKFLLKISEFKSVFEEGSRHVSIEIMDFLADWFTNHILGTDRQLSTGFNKKW